MTMSLDRRRFLAGAGLGALGLGSSSLLSACSSSGSKSGTIQLWMDIAGAANQKYFNENVVDAFTKLHRGLQLKTTYYKGEDLRRLIQTALQAKSGPDIVRGPSATQTLAWSKAHVLADLSTYSKQYKWNDTIVDWAIEAFTVDGKLYALPMRVDTMLLYYNRTLFEDKHWTVPKNRDDLESLAAEAHGQGIIPFGASNVDWKAASEWLMTVFWNHYSGPDALHQALTGKIAFTDPVFVEAVQLLKSYFDKGWMGGGTDKYFSVPSQEMGASFGNGKVAMFPQGGWWMSAVGTFFGEAANNHNDWDWTPLPALRSEVAYPLYEIGIGGSLGINASSKNKDDAAKYLDWYYDDKKAALTRMADVPSTYNIPIEFTDAEIPSSIDKRSGRVLTAVNKAIADGDYGYVTWTWWPAKADTFVYEGLDKVLTGKTSPKDYCKQLDDIFQGERRSGGVPKLIDRKSSQ